MQMGGAPAGASVSALRMQNTALSRSGKSLALASAQGDLGFPAFARHVRRILGPRGSAARQDVLVAADTGMSSEEGTDLEACVAHR